ncbi:hypothetical protein Tco_1478884, partial [Tanacetum coccineum]
EGSEQSHSVSSGTVPDPQDLERDIQLPSTRLPSTLNVGTHKSQPLPKGTKTDPQDLERDIQLPSTRLPSTLNVGTHKLQPLPKGTKTDPKDSVGNKQPIDKGLPSMDFDEGTTKTTLRYQSLTENKGKPSHEGELDTQPLVLSTYADVRAFLLYDDEAQENKPTSSTALYTEASDSNSSSNDLLKKYDNTLPLTKRKLVKYLRKVSTVLFNIITEDSWEKHKEAAVNYANLKASIDDYYDENIAHIDQIDKLVEASLSSLVKSHTTTIDLYKGRNVITELLKEINNAVKDNPAMNKKISEATESFPKISTNIIEVLSLVKGFNFSDLQSFVNALRLM